MFDDHFLIEAHGRVVGVAVRVRGGYMFFSSDSDLKELEAKIFPQAKSIARRVADFARAKRRTNNQSCGRADIVVPLRQRARRRTDDPPPTTAA